MFITTHALLSVCGQVSYWIEEDSVSQDVNVIIATIVPDSWIFFCFSMCPEATCMQTGKMIVLKADSWDPPQKTESESLIGPGNLKFNKLSLGIVNP